MAILENRLEVPVSVALSTLSPADVFLHGGVHYLKITGSTEGGAINLVTFAPTAISAPTMVTPVDAFIDEV